MSTSVKLGCLLALSILFLGLSGLQFKQPLNITNNWKEPIKSSSVELLMERMGYPKELASSIEFAASRTNLCPKFVIALIFTESSFKTKARSSKGYYGLLQIPYEIEDPDSNLLIGCKEFNKKLKLAKGDLTKAIMLYKGYYKKKDQKRGKQQAEKVMTLYNRLINVDMI